MKYKEFIEFEGKLIPIKMGPEGTLSNGNNKRKENGQNWYSREMANG